VNKTKIEPIELINLREKAMQDYVKWQIKIIDEVIYLSLTRQLPTTTKETTP